MEKVVRIALRNHTHIITYSYCDPRARMSWMYGLFLAETSFFSLFSSTIACSAPTPDVAICLALARKLEIMASPSWNKHTVRNSKFSLFLEKHDQKQRFHLLEKLFTKLNRCQPDFWLKLDTVNYLYECCTMENWQTTQVTRFPSTLNKTLYIVVPKWQQFPLVIIGEIKSQSFMYIISVPSLICLDQWQNDCFSGSWYNLEYQLPAYSDDRLFPCGSLAPQWWPWPSQSWPNFKSINLDNLVLFMTYLKMFHWMYTGTVCIMVQCYDNKHPCITPKTMDYKVLPFYSQVGL